MTAMDVLLASEESKQKISEIRSSPTSLSFGKYRIQIERDLLRYFVYKWRQVSVVKERIYNLDNLSSDDFWDAFVTTPYHDAKSAKKKLVEVEVDYAEWLAS